MLAAHERRLTMTRATLFVSALLLSNLPALAQEPASTDAVYACASENDDMARLACYDDAVGRLKAAEEAGEVTTISKAEVEEVQRDAFGFSLPSLPKLAMPRFGNSDSDDDGTIKSVTTAVTNVKKSKINGLTVTLENGQVWQQTDGRRVSYSKRKGVKEAEVKKASFGSFMMKLDGGVAFRVKRLK